jgi:SDR family mycofactocin-dependent oxidoreductase
MLGQQPEGEAVGDGAQGRVKGKVAFITGAARGQGRSHAVRLAEEGADIIAVDLCCDIDTIGYPMAAPEDLDETARLIEKTGQAVVTAQADVRDVAQLSAALDSGLAEFGRLDIVVAQAGVAGMKGQPPLQAWCDVINTNLIGTINAIQVALPRLGAGASIIATGSTAALMDTSKKDVPGNDPGGMAYVHSKRALAGYVHDLATELAPLGIRANVVHPTNCNTPMLQSEPMYRSFRPDLERPTRADAEPVFGVQQAMQIPYIEPEDISNAVLWLASDEARYVTGMQLRVDAGGYLKWYDYHN